jgi:hypothetical protein
MSAAAAAVKPKFTSFYRLAGMGYLDSLAVASTALRTVLREPARTEALARTNFVSAPSSMRARGRAAPHSLTHSLTTLPCCLLLPPFQKYREFFYEDGKESLPNEFFSNPTLAKKK